MPQEVPSETLELGRNDITDNASNRSGIPKIRVIPTCRLMPRTDNYNEEEPYSNSDDEGPFSPESDEAAISRFEDSRNFEKTNDKVVRTLFQSLSLGSDTSADSVDSVISEERNVGPWIGSSTECSPYSSTSYSCSESDNESSEDEEEFDIEKELNEIKRDHNSNYQPTSKNDNDDNDEKYESSSTRTIPVPSKNEERDDDSSDDDSSDDDSKDKVGVEVITRGIMAKSHPHNGKTPYDRPSPSPRQGSTTEALTPDDGSIYARSVSFSPRYEESDHTSDDNSNDNKFLGEIEAQPTSLGPYSTSYHNGEILDMFEDSIGTDYRNQMAQYLPPGCDVPQCEPEELINLLLQQHPDELNSAIEILEENRSRSSSQSPNENLPIHGVTGDRGDNSTNSPPLITINDDALFSIPSPQNTAFRTVNHPWSPASSSNSYDHSQHSPGTYATDIEVGIGDSISQRFGVMGCDEPIFPTPNLTPTQNASPTHSLELVTLSELENETNGYTHFSDSMINTQGNPNISQSDFYTISNTQTGTQAQMSPSQITDSYPSVMPRLTQYQSNVVQYQPTTIQSFNSIQREVNSLSTSRGIMHITPKDEIGKTIMAIGQTSANLQDPTYNTINCNGGQTRKTKSKKIKNQRRTIPTTPSPIPPAVEDDLHLPTILNTPSPNEKKSLRAIAPWSLSRLPPISAVDRLRQEVDEKDAQAAMVKLFEYTYDDYKEQTPELGDTYLMTIVRNSKVLASRLAHITPVLDKMTMIPESLTIRNKEGHDALYLAAINCPEFGYVTSVIAATIAESCKSNDIWQRKYDYNGQTLLHALAARGDSHADVLRELLGVQKAMNRTLFDLSATNMDGKTPLHVAVEAHVRVKSVDVVRLLRDWGANPMITDYNAGNTPLHMAMSNKSCIGIVQALLLNGGEKAVNISNRAGNTPLHLAAEILNNASQNTQREICWQLITAGAKTNIYNRHGKVPYFYVAANRREMMQKIFYKKL